MIHKLTLHMLGKCRLEVLSTNPANFLEARFWIASDLPTIPELARLLFMRAFRGSNPKANRITFT